MKNIATKIAFSGYILIRWIIFWIRYKHYKIFLSLTSWSLKSLIHFISKFVTVFNLTHMDISLLRYRLKFFSCRIECRKKYIMFTLSFFDSVNYWQNAKLRNQAFRINANMAGELKGSKSPTFLVTDKLHAISHRKSILITHILV